MRSLAAAIQRSISLVPSAAVVVAGVVLVVDVEKTGRRRADAIALVLLVFSAITASFPGSGVRRFP